VKKRGEKTREGKKAPRGENSSVNVPSKAQHEKGCYKNGKGRTFFNPKEGREIETKREEEIK